MRRDAAGPAAGKHFQGRELARLRGVQQLLAPLKHGKLQREEKKKKEKMKKKRGG